MGYPWADEPRNHGVVMVTGDDHQAVVDNAERLAKHFWQVRNEFVFVVPTTSFEESMALALKSKDKPYIISDMGDNPTAGGAGDVTWMLKEILAMPIFQSDSGPELIYVSIPGPDFISKALVAGEGSMVTGSVGAMVDDRYAGRPHYLKSKGLVYSKRRSSCSRRSCGTSWQCKSYCYPKKKTLSL